MFSTITGSTLQAVIKEANTLGIKKEDYIQTISYTGGFALIYFKN